MAARAPITVGDFIRGATRHFERARLHFGHGTHSARDEAVVLVLHALRLSYGALRASLTRRLSAGERSRLDFNAAYAPSEYAFGGSVLGVTTDVLDQQLELEAMWSLSF